MVSPYPQPDEHALAHSRALVRRIRDALDAAGGWMGFETYMEHALYEPGLGYYTGGSMKFGPRGDFVTAPELTPLFGRALAGQLAQWLAPFSEPVILELGAGTGALAQDVLRGLEGTSIAPRYWIVERSGELRHRQRERLAQFGRRVTWLDALPETPFQGLILANEVVDALAFSCFIKRAGETAPLGVRWTNGAFAWAEGPSDPALSAAVRVLEGRFGMALGDGYRSEIRLGLPAWIQALAAPLRHGAILIIDFGLVGREYYHPDRNQGTLLCHYRHRAHGDPFLFPGLQDISAWVDFSALADAALDNGLRVSGLTTQAQFLLESGALGALPTPPSAGDAQALRTLMLPGEMGERFKLLLLSRDYAGAELPGRDYGDRL